jgi:hypothetical protein
MSVAAAASIRTQSTSRGLNVALWIVQVLVAALFAMAGFMKTTTPIVDLSQKMAWVSRFSPGMVRFIGTSELLGAAGLLLPSLSRIKPILTPIAAAALTVVMILAAGTHLMNGEAQHLPMVVVLGALTTFVAWGRWKKAPIAPR